LKIIFPLIQQIADQALHARCLRRNVRVRSTLLPPQWCADSGALSGQACFGKLIRMKHHYLHKL